MLFFASDFFMKCYYGIQQATDIPVSMTIDDENLRMYLLINDPSTEGRASSILVINMTCMEEEIATRPPGYGRPFEPYNGYGQSACINTVFARNSFLNHPVSIFFDPRSAHAETGFDSSGSLVISRSVYRTVPILLHWIVCIYLVSSNCVCALSETIHPRCSSCCLLIWWKHSLFSTIECDLW